MNIGRKSFETENIPSDEIAQPQEDNRVVQPESVIFKPQATELKTEQVLPVPRNDAASENNVTTDKVGETGTVEAENFNTANSSQGSMQERKINELSNSRHFGYGSKPQATVGDKIYRQYVELKKAA